MALFSRKTSDSDIAEYKAAKKALHDNQRHEIAAGIDESTAEYERLNACVNETIKNVPWYRR